MQKRVRVCNGKWCSFHKSKGIFKVIKKSFGLKFSNKNDKIDLDYCPCVGYCSSAPNVRVGDNMIFLAEEGNVVELIEKGGAEIKKGSVKIDFEDDFLGDL